VHQFDWRASEGSSALEARLCCVQRLHIEPCPDALLSSIAQSKLAIRRIRLPAQKIATEAGLHACNPAVGMHQMRAERLLRVLR
jgi:hypothetical protein